MALNDEDYYVHHPEKKHLISKVSVKRAIVPFGQTPMQNPYIKSAVDHANKFHGPGHIAKTGRDLEYEGGYTWKPEKMSTKKESYQQPFSNLSAAKGFAPLTEEQVAALPVVESNNPFEWKAFVAARKERDGENLTKHDKSKTSNGAVYKRKEGLKDADDADVVAAPKRGRGRPPGKYGSYKKKIKEMVEMARSIAESGLTSEEVEAYMQTEAYAQLDELSKATLGSYIKKAALKVADHSYKAAKNPNNGDFGKASKKIQGITTASTKLAKGTPQYIVKDFDDKKDRPSLNLPRVDHKAAYNAEIDEYQARLKRKREEAEESERRYQALLKKDENKGHKGTQKTSAKLTKEEVERIDELSKKTLGSYINKASKSASAHSANTQYHADTKGMGSAAEGQERMLRVKRENGISKAVAKLTKEEVERLDELSRAKVGDYVNKASDSVASKARSGDVAGARKRYAQIQKALGKSGFKRAMNQEDTKLSVQKDNQIDENGVKLNPNDKPTGAITESSISKLSMGSIFRSALHVEPK